VTDFIDSNQRIKEKSFLLMVPLFAAASLVWAGFYYYYGLKHRHLFRETLVLFPFHHCSTNYFIE